MNVSHAPPGLDIYSVKAMALVTLLAVCLMTLSAWKVNERIPGMRLFTLGLLSVSLGAVAGMARVLIQGDTIFVVCNALMLGGMIAISQSVRIFRGRPLLSRGFISGLVAVVAAAYFWWLLVHDDFGVRVGIISGAMALISSDSASSMFRRVGAGDRSVYWPTGFAFSFTAGYLFIRAAGAFAGVYGSSIWAPVPMEVALTVCANAACIGCAFGMLVASNARLRRESEQMALTDPLTSLANRRSFAERLLEAETRSLSTNRKFGLIYLDLDRFKLVNDTHGHRAGDEFLKRIAAAMSAALRPCDCLGRVGGDEFIALIENVQDYRDLGNIAENLKEVVESEPVAPGSGASIRASCGIAIFPDDGDSAHDVMSQADHAMYREKLGSRQSHAIASSSSRMRRSRKDAGFRFRA